jgi:hypothetical protein
MTEATATEPSNETLTAETMFGDLVSLVIDEIKAAPDVWQKLSEFQQDEVIGRVRQRVEFNVRQAVKLIASEGREVITAELEQITAKDGIKAVCTLAKHDPNRHALLDSVGKAVLIVVADSSQFLNGEMPKPDPQQPDLIDQAVSTFTTLQ